MNNLYRSEKLRNALKNISDYARERDGSLYLSKQNLITIFCG